MNKNLKRIIALTLIMGIYTAVEPVKYINLTSAKVYAETTSIYLDELYMNKGDIEFDSEKTYYNVKVDDALDEVKICARPKSSNSEVKINGVMVGLMNNYKEVVHLDRGENVIRVEVRNNDNVSKFYTLIVTRGKSSLDNIYLKNLTLSAGAINFNKETNSYNIDVKQEVDKIKIKANPEDEDNIVEIDGLRVDKDSNYEKTIKLENGKNEILVSVKNKKFNNANDDKKRSYILNINRQKNSNTIESKEDVYLNALRVSDKEIRLSKADTYYNVRVNDGIYKATIKLEPENDKYMVQVNGDAVEESGDYEKAIMLNDDKTEVKIKVEDLSGKKRTYTINIYTKDIPKSDEELIKTLNAANHKNAGAKINQWAQINNKWQYNDAIGNPIKNSWFYDKNYGKTYYFQGDGTMATGWLNNNGKWYYLGVDGAMKTGWIIDGSKYYYLYSDGTMAYNTTVNGYKIDENGVWIN
jgi:glucan-binding YG repeat protein